MSCSVCSASWLHLATEYPLLANGSWCAYGRMRDTFGLEVSLPLQISDGIFSSLDTSEFCRIIITFDFDSESESQSLWFPFEAGRVPWFMYFLDRFN